MLCDSKPLQSLNSAEFLVFTSWVSLIAITEQAINASKETTLGLPSKCVRKAQRCGIFTCQRLALSHCHSHFPSAQEEAWPWCCGDIAECYLEPPSYKEASCRWVHIRSEDLHITYSLHFLYPHSATYWQMSIKNPQAIHQLQECTKEKKISDKSKWVFWGERGNRCRSVSWKSKAHEGFPPASQ